METEKEGMIMESPSKESISIYRNGEWVIYHSASSIAQLATDGREELEKEIKAMVMFNENAKAKITALQSQCTEKDQEIERLQGIIDQVFFKDLP